jgi:hypothetical protein
MKSTRAQKLCVLGSAFAVAAAQADPAPQPPAQLGEHPAVLVARKGVPTDPTSRFYLHPARLSWNLSRPLSEGEHPAVLVARRGLDPKIDPNHFIVGHPAGGGPPDRAP